MGFVYPEVVSSLIHTTLSYWQRFKDIAREQFYSLTELIQFDAIITLVVRVH
jgi:hypothetical protein